MSQAAWNLNCLACRTLAALRKGTVKFADRPCPSVTPPGLKYAIKLSPDQVRTRMPKAWKCPAKGGAS